MAACFGLAANEKLVGSGFLKEPVTVLEKGEAPSNWLFGEKKQGNLSLWQRKRES